MCILLILREHHMYCTHWSWKDIKILASNHRCAFKIHIWLLMKLMMFDICYIIIKNTTLWFLIHLYSLLYVHVFCSFMHHHQNLYVHRTIFSSFFIMTKYLSWRWIKRKVMIKRNEVLTPHKKYSSIHLVREYFFPLALSKNGKR